MKNVAMVGSRTFVDNDVIYRAIKRLLATNDDVTVVSGGARGADMIAMQEARALGAGVIVYYPDWDKFGKSAGYRRNEQIVAKSDMLIAFFADGPKSKGTQHSVDLALKKGIPVHIYHEGKWESHMTMGLA